MRTSTISAIAAGAILAQGPALAADARVPADFATIQRAVRQAADSNGDGTITIRVAPGTYTENVRIRRSGIRLLGGGARNTTIQAASGDLSVIKIKSANDVQISGFTVTGSASHDGIKVRRADGVVIADNTVTGNRHGITLRSSDDGMIEDNEVSGNRKSALKIRSGDDNTARGNDLSGNGKGIDLRGGTDNEISGNEINNNRSVGIRLRNDAEGTTVRDNRITGNGDDGIRLRDVSRSDILNNTVSSNDENGIRTRDTEDTVISQNTIQLNLEYGVRRRDDLGDDYNNLQAGDQRPPGNNTISGNLEGDIRTD
jgi:parallel beta-helix repeat protein